MACFICVVLVTSTYLHFSYININYMEEIQEYFRVHGPDVLKATLILIIGWILAWIVAGIIRKLLRKTSLDNRLVKWMSDGDTSKA